MKQTTWQEILGYKFEIETQDEWLRGSEHYNKGRLADDIVKWLDETITYENYMRVFDRNKIACIAFKKKEDLLLFVMTWT